MEKSFDWRRKLWVLGVMATMFGSACAAEVLEQGEREAEVAMASEPLVISSFAIWTRLSIPVCWENFAHSTATQRFWVQDQITKTWQANSLVKFTGWGQCAATSQGLRIGIDNTVAAQTVGVGIENDGVKNGMRLNMAVAPLYSGCLAQGHTVERCVRHLATHEFGHALGFQHEEQRPNTACRKEALLGDTTVGAAYDPLSVMTGCDNWPVTLSATDIKGLRQYYGSSTFAANNKEGINWSAGAPNGKGRIYFMNGGEYTRYDMALDRAASGFPLPIVGRWTGWPAAWSTGPGASINWENGKVFFFKGAQYLRFDIATDRVDQAPRDIFTPDPAVADNWPNWPTIGWTSIDAGMKWNNSFAFFFKGPNYIRFNVALNRVDQVARPIAGNWPGLTLDAVDYVVKWDSNTFYFFRKDKYWRYETGTDPAFPKQGVPAGWPQLIVGNWAGVPFSS